MIGEQPRTADSNEAVPDVTMDNSEIDRNSRIEFSLINTGRLLS